MQIIVKRRKPCGKYLYLDVEASDTIDAILARIAEIDGSPVEQFGLHKWDQGLFTLSDYFIPDGFTVLLRQQFEITIVMMNGRTFTLEVDAADEVDTVKGWIEDQERIDCDCARREHACSALYIVVAANVRRKLSPIRPGLHNKPASNRSAD